MERIGRYELTGRLGEGGAGTVYRAVLHGPGGLRRDVALKVLKRGGEGLRREARLGGLLRHRNLVDVYEIGEAEGQWFCAMELCERGALTGWLPLPPRAVVEVGLAVCEALQYAHEELGLVHLDLKPDNLLVSEEGTVKVADLGVARAEGFALDGVRGTRGYMAPEQAAGSAVDARADQYALGMTLVTLATGQLPGASETLSMETIDLDGELPEVGEGGDGIPEWLRPAVERCLEPDPLRRWPNMAALGEALRRLGPSGAGLVEVVGGAVSEEAVGGVGAVPGFVGREDALEALGEALAEPGAVCVKGAPGVGKSAVAREAARTWAEAGDGRAWRCELGEAAALDEAVARVARCLGVVRGGPRAVERRLGREPAVLVLDHGERVEGLVEQVWRWLAAAPMLRVMLPTRRALALPTVELGPLDREASVALVRARARERGVELGADPRLERLADRLEGLPLALSLAAGRLGVLSVGDVLERLEQGVLRAGSGDRHDTLEAALAWSWEELEPAERQALVELSSFVGGFTLGAAEAVCAVDPVLPVLDALADQSLVVARGDRLELPAAVRSFAASRGERSAAEARHGRFFAALGERPAMQATGAEGERLQQRRTMAVDELVAAVRRAVARGDGAVAESAAMAAWRVLRISGPLRSIRELAELALSARPDASSLHMLIGEVELRVGRPSEAAEWLERSLELARSRGERWQEGAALGGLGRVNQQAHRVAEARACHEEALGIYEELGSVVAAATCMANLGTLRRLAGEVDAGEALLRRALERFRELGERASEAETLGNLAGLYSEADRPADAVQTGEEALRIARELDYRPFEGFVLGNLGEARWQLGDLERARADLEAAVGIHREEGTMGLEGHYRFLLGDLARESGDEAEARRWYSEAEPLLVRAEDPVGQALVACGLALLDAAAGELGVAKAHRLRAEALVGGMETPPAVRDRLELVRTAVP